MNWKNILKPSLIQVIGSFIIVAVLFIFISMSVCNPPCYGDFFKNNYLILIIFFIIIYVSFFIINNRKKK